MEKQNWKWLLIIGASTILSGIIILAATRKKIRSAIDARALRIPERKWKKLTHAQLNTQPVFQQTVKAKVITYNILAHCYVKKADDRGCYDKRIDRDLLYNWQYRAERVLMEIEQEMPNILCLQEVDHYEEFYKPRLAALGYQTEIMWRQSLGRRGKDSELIGFRDEYSLVDRAEIVYEDLAGRYRTHGDKLTEQFQKWNVGLILLLKHQTGAKIIVVCTHLYWNPTHDYVKYAQAFWIQKSIADFCQSRDESLFNVPMIICGDFNGDAQSSAMHSMYNKNYELTKERCDMKTGIKAYQTQFGIDAFRIVEKDFQKTATQLPLNRVVGTFRSAYEHFKAVDFSSKNDWAEKLKAAHPPYSGSPVMFPGLGSIDYVFYTPRLLRLTELLDLPEHGDVVGEFGCLPNTLFPSDHLRMGAIFELPIDPKNELSQVESTNLEESNWTFASMELSKIN